MRPHVHYADIGTGDTQVTLPADLSQATVGADIDDVVYLVQLGSHTTGSSFNAPTYADNGASAGLTQDFTPNAPPANGSRVNIYRRKLTAADFVSNDPANGLRGWKNDTTGWNPLSNFCFLLLKHEDGFDNSVLFAVSAGHTSNVANGTQIFPTWTTGSGNLPRDGLALVFLAQGSTYTTTGATITWWNGSAQNHFCDEQARSIGTPFTACPRGDRNRLGHSTVNATCGLTVGSNLATNGSATKDHIGRPFTDSPAVSVPGGTRIQDATVNTSYTMTTTPNPANAAANCILGLPNIGRDKHGMWDMTQIDSGTALSSLSFAVSAGSSNTTHQFVALVLIPAPPVVHGNNAIHEEVPNAGSIKFIVQGNAVEIVDEPHGSVPGIPGNNAIHEEHPNAGSIYNPTVVFGNTAIIEDVPQPQGGFVFTEFNWDIANPGADPPRTEILKATLLWRGRRLNADDEGEVLLQLLQGSTVIAEGATWANLQLTAQDFLLDVNVALITNQADLHGRARFRRRDENTLTPVTEFVDFIAEILAIHTETPLAGTIINPTVIMGNTAIIEEIPLAQGGQFPIVVGETRFEVLGEPEFIIGGV